MLKMTMESVLLKSKTLAVRLPNCCMFRMLVCRYRYKIVKSSNFATATVASEKDEICQEKARKIKRIKIEIDEFRIWNDGYPKKISVKDWEALINQLKIESQRNHLYTQISKNEKLEEKQREKKHSIEISKTFSVNKSFVFLDGSEKYSAFNHNKSLWGARVQEKLYMNAFHGAIHGVPIVLDYGFESDYTGQKQAKTFTEICNKINLHHKSPQRLILTGCENEEMKRSSDSPDNLFVDIFNHDVMDLFDKRQLVYLCPDAPPLNSFEDDKVYVIQGMKAKNPHAQCAYLKAKEYGVQYGSFPLSRYQSMNSDLDEAYIPGQVRTFSLLLDLFHYKNFEEAVSKHNFKEKIKFF